MLRSFLFVEPVAPENQSSAVERATEASAKLPNSRYVLLLYWVPVLGTAIRALMEPSWESTLFCLGAAVYLAGVLFIVRARAWLRQYAAGATDD